MSKKSGFTLVELLLVVVILSIVALITVPIVLDIIKDAINRANLNSAYGILDATRLYRIEKMFKEEFDDDGGNIYDNLKLKGRKPEFGDVRVKKDGAIALALKYGDKCYEKPYDGSKINHVPFSILTCVASEDVIAPSVTITPVGNPFNENGWAKDNFNVRIAIEDTESGPKSYKWCSTTSDSCQPNNLSLLPFGFVNMTEESNSSKICVIGFDLKDNESSITCSDSYKLDKTNPEIDGLSDLLINQGAFVNLQAGVTVSDSLSGVEGEFTYTPENIDTSVVGIQNVIYKAKDNAGNEIEKTRTIRIVSGTPLLSFENVGNPFNEKGWAKNDFEIKISTIDINNQGIKNIKYCVSEASCTPNTLENNSNKIIQITKESKINKICATVIDNADKSSGITCSSDYKLDKTVPNIDGLSDLTVSLGSTPNLTIDVVATDNLSGIDGTYLISNLDTSTMGLKMLTYTVYDNAGNATTKTRKVEVVLGTPGLTYSTNGSFNTSGWANVNFDVNISAKDNNNAGIKNIKYCITTTTCTPVTNVNASFVSVFINTESTNNKVCAIIEDNYGQKSDTVCSNSYKLDKTGPVINGLTDIYVNIGSIVDLSSNVTVTDSLSGMSGTFSVGSVDTSTAGTKTVSYTAYDSAGNVSVKNRNVIVKEIFDLAKGVNRPQLIQGMTPIKWDTNNNEIVTNENDNEWYDYTNKKWANTKTNDGSYWVWIPRYAYTITSGFHTVNAGAIEIKFLKNKTIENVSLTPIETSGYNADTKNTTMHYFLHPVFNGDNEYGFWMAKFEASGGSATVNIVPGVTATKNMTVNNQFTLAFEMRNKSQYGWTNKTNTHMVTNLEWGAVAYLSHSIYGKNAEVWMNPSSSFITGCAGTGPSVSSSSGCAHQYNTTNGMQASTTGNITGIYDMSGGAYERVAAYVNNGNSALNSYGKSLINADSKYKEIYPKGTSDSQANNYAAIKNWYGDAIWEISNNINGAYAWYNDYSAIPSGTLPFFLRGGINGDGTKAGIFHFNSSYGNSLFSSDCAIRVVVSGILEP